MAQPAAQPADRRGREGNPNDPLHYVVTTAEAHAGADLVVLDTLNCSCIFSPDDQQKHATLAAAAPLMLSVLREVEGFLDDRADADDGIPNEAMSLLTEVRAAIRATEEGQ